MGCDIHAYIERDGYLWIDARLARNYTMFGLMAGVRTNIEPVVAPRGIPKDASRGVLAEYTLRIVPEDKVDYDHNECTLDDAHKWGAEWWDDKQDRIVGPDWHTPSWLNATELEEVLLRYDVIAENRRGEWVPRYATDEKYDLMIREESEDYRAFLAAMKVLNGDDENRSRLVFWFDN